MSKYYVYKHVDPNTSELLYIGMGSGGRAWQVGKSHGPLRGEEHNEWSESLMAVGITPDKFVEIIQSGLEREEAYNLELSLIKEFRPKFNKNFSRSTKLSSDQVHEARVLKETGISYEAIGRELSVSTMTAYRAVKGITLAHT